MSLFKNKKESNWTIETAPKIKKLGLEICIQLTGRKPKDDWSSGDDKITDNKITKSLLVTTDSSKKDIKKSIENEMFKVYNEICEAIDSDNLLLTNEFWENNNLSKEE